MYLAGNSDIEPASTCIELKPQTIGDEGWSRLDHENFRVADTGGGLLAASI